MRYKRLIAAALTTVLTFPFLACLGASAEDGVVSAGKSYTVSYVTPIENAYPNMAYTPEKKLTDGKIAAADYNDASWTMLYRGTAAVVTVDLESVMSVSRVTMGQLQCKSAGIECSRYINVLVSEDGVNFGTAVTYEDPSKITLAAKQRILFDVDMNGSFKARYVRLVFSSDVNTYVDEITIYGSSDTAGATTVKADEEKPDIGFAKELDGIANICLMYISSNYTKDMIKPYFAYYDSKGDYTDTMFDSLLFLGMPQTSAEDGYMRKSDMEGFVKSALCNGVERNIDALDAVVGEMKSELGLGADYKYPIFISVPFPGVFSDAFGEINGETVTGATFENRRKIMQWYVDYVTEQYNDCGFENLELKGLYWFAESVYYTLSTYEEELIKSFNDYCHSKSLKTIWIPYYSATGIDKAVELGFDAATMQSGHAFENEAIGSTKPECVNDCAATAKKFGLGMEFEVDIGVSGYMKRFAQYVHVAYKEGLMDGGIMMMYQVGTNLLTSATGSVSNRALYELTYQYCSKTYREAVPVIEKGQIITVKVGGYTKGKLKISDEDTNLTKLKVATCEKPEGVYLVLEGDGFYEAEAYNSVPGTYIARFSVTDGYNESEIVEITVIVEPSDEEPSGSTSESSEATDNNGKSNNVLYYVIGAVIAIAAVLAVILVKKRKKTNNL